MAGEAESGTSPTMKEVGPLSSRLWDLRTTFGYIHGLRVCYWCIGIQGFTRTVACNCLARRLGSFRQLRRKNTLCFSFLVNFVHPPCRVLQRCWSRVPAEFRSVGVVL